MGHALKRHMKPGRRAGEKGGRRSDARTFFPRRDGWRKALQARSHMWASKGERMGNQPVQDRWHAGT